jgi:hypothetical protein
MTYHIFAGNKGGGPKNAADNLFSEDSVEIIIGISEGPIKGVKGSDQLIRTSSSATRRSSDRTASRTSRTSSGIC